MEKKIKIQISSVQSDLGETFLSHLFDELEGEAADNAAEEIKEKAETEDLSVEPAKMESSTEGILREEDGRVTVSYSETELTGMEGATTNISFDLSNTGLVTMLRGGSVTTSLVFEQDKRHVSIYETPFMPFEICILTLKVDNRLLDDGELYLDYVVEVKGAQAERTKFKMTVSKLTETLSPMKEYEE